MVILRRLRRQAAPALLALLLLAGAGALRADARSELEGQVKAAFLFNFTKFVEWPPEAFKEAGDPVTLCVAGEDAVGESLDMLVQGATVGSRRLTVHRTRSLAELRGCHLVFVPGAERRRQQEILSSLQGTSILTVGDSVGFLTDGGVIRFVLDQNRVRFEINLAAAQGNGLKLSSQLLRLARTVYEKQPGQGD
jgi:hypothetical protein